MLQSPPVAGAGGALAYQGIFVGYFNYDDLSRFYVSVAFPLVMTALLLVTLLLDAQARDRAIAAGLKDHDRHVVQAAMNEARTNLPDIAVPVLAKRLSAGDFPHELRVRALDGSPATNAAAAVMVLIVMMWFLRCQNAPPRTAGCLGQR